LRYVDASKLPVERLPRLAVRVAAAVLSANPKVVRCCAFLLGLPLGDEPEEVGCVGCPIALQLRKLQE
jgi:hypothetical protein